MVAGLTVVLGAIGIACVLLAALTPHHIVLGIAVTVPASYWLVSDRLGAPYKQIGAPAGGGPNSGRSASSTTLGSSAAGLVGVFAFLSFGLLTAAAATGASKSGLFIAYVVLSVLYALSLFGTTGTVPASAVRGCPRVHQSNPNPPPWARVHQSSAPRGHACTSPTLNPARALWRPWRPWDLG